MMPRFRRLILGQNLVFVALALLLVRPLGFAALGVVWLGATAAFMFWWDGRMRYNLWNLFVVLQEVPYNLLLVAGRTGVAWIAWVAVGAFGLAAFFFGLAYGRRYAYACYHSRDFYARWRKDWRLLKDWGG